MTAGQAAYVAYYPWRQCSWCDRVRTGHAPRGWYYTGRGLTACGGCWRRHRAGLRSPAAPLSRLCTLPMVFTAHRPGTLLYDHAALARFRQGLVQP